MNETVFEIGTKIETLTNKAAAVAYLLTEAADGGSSLNRDYIGWAGTDIMDKLKLIEESVKDLYTALNDAETKTV